MKKIVSLLMLAVFALQVNAQDLSAYKYIIVPKQFSFQKEPNQYNINALTKFLFKKYGFDAYITGESLPIDANTNGCNTLTMEADAGGFLGTHLTYTLANCQGQVVYTSPEGKSKIKEYEGAYNEVMRDAMAGLEELGYAYSDEVIQMKKNPADDAVATNENTPSNSSIAPTETSTTSVSTVVVGSTPESPKKTTATTTPENPKTAQTNTRTSQTSVKSASTAAVFTSTDGSYSLRRTATGFDFYEGESKIGEARQTSAGSYLVNTSAFVGIGNLDGDTFIVEREIKGVDGLIQMKFKANN